MKRYNIYYRKYNIIANDYIPYIKVVYTDDIYHEIGKMICTSMEKIEAISYTEPKASQEECEQMWVEDGYRKLSNNIPIHHNYFPKTVLRVREQLLLSHNPYNYLEREFVLCKRCGNEFNRFMKGEGNERKVD